MTLEMSMRKRKKYRERMYENISLIFTYKTVLKYHLSPILTFSNLGWCSVQFSSVVSDFLQSHEPQHARPPCPSPTPGVHPNPCPLCRWCHSTISSSVIPFFSGPQFFPASGSFQISQLSASGGQSIGVSLQHQSLQWTSRTDLL